MSFACTVLHWTPQDFWAASLGELGSAAAPFGPMEDGAMPLGGLHGLMARFPDEQTGKEPDGI